MVRAHGTLSGSVKILAAAVSARTRALPHLPLMGDAPQPLAVSVLLRLAAAAALRPV